MHKRKNLHPRITTMNNQRFIGHLSLFAAYMIFAFNIIVCKEIMLSAYMSPMGLFFFRSVGAGALFWLLSLFVPRNVFNAGTKEKAEKVPTKDLLAILGASVVGLVFPQLTFLEGISLTTPLDCSLLVILTPIFTMFVAAIVLKEPITLKKAGGVALSFAGVILLIFNSVSLGGGATTTKPLGVVLLILNALCFALYLGIFRPLISRYSVVTFMKWMFLFATLLSFPLCAKEVCAVNYAALPADYYWRVGFLIFFATFTAYFLIPVGQKVLRPTIVSLYTYVQPLVASVISIYLGMDQLTWQKLVAAAAIVGGVVLVNRSRAAKVEDGE